MDEFVQGHVTFDEVEAGEVSAVALLSNSETSAAAHWAAAGREKQCAYGNSFAALEANMRIGGHLRELKKISRHGEYGREVTARLGFDRGWSARLAQLHKEWPYVLQAVELAISEKRLTRSEIGVDRALALLAAWRRETANDGGAADKSSSDDGYVSNKTISKKKLIEQLKQIILKLLHKLLQAQQYIAFLESEVERLTGAAPQEARSEGQLLLPLPTEAPCPDQLLLPFAEHMQ